MNLDEAVAHYIKLRDHKAVLKKKYDDSVESINERLKKLEAAFTKHFEKTGQSSCKTPSGTAYTATRVTCTVQDKDAFLKFVRETGGDEFVESKANSTAVKDYMEEHEEPPPGVSVSVRRVINVNRG